MSDGCSTFTLSSPRARFDAFDDLAVELAEVDVLQPPFLLVHARVVARAELVGAEERQDVVVVRRDVPVPRRRAAARHDDQLIVVQAGVGLRPRQERNPVEQLEAGFSQPRPDDDRTVLPAEHRDHFLGLVDLRHAGEQQALRRVAMLVQLRRQDRARLLPQLRRLLADDLLQPR